MKSVFILDTPKICGECRFKQANINPADELVWLCSLNDEHIEYGEKSEYCPLRCLPDKFIPDDVCYRKGKAYCNEAFAFGYNSCIDELLGETDDNSNL